MWASCQLLAADAGGETQIIFYLRTSACLSSWRHPLDDCRAESFGGRINCGRESCGTSSDDSHIADHFGSRSFCDDQLIWQLRAVRAAGYSPGRESKCW